MTKKKKINELTLELEKAKKENELLKKNNFHLRAQLCEKNNIIRVLCECHAFEYIMPVIDSYSDYKIVLPKRERKKEIIYDAVTEQIASEVEVDE